MLPDAPRRSCAQRGKVTNAPVATVKTKRTTYFVESDCSTSKTLVGMEDGEHSVAREDLAVLEKDYEEAAADSEEDG